MSTLLALFRRLVGLPPGASTVADDVDLLHMSIIGVTMIMSTLIFGVAAYFAIRWHRKREGELTERIVATRLREIVIIGGVTTTFVVWWIFGFRQYVAMADPPPGSQVVYVDAKQWMWKFVYADGRATNDTLTVPAGKPIKLVMTSRDVIHSFYVPAFRVKQDLLPGRYTTLWFEAKTPGTYPIWCAEYCGPSHSLMRGQVVVLSPEDYARWKETPEAPDPNADCGRGPGSCSGGRPESLAARGKEIATRRGCVACHTMDGQRHIGPTWRGLFGKERVLTDGRRVVADEAYLTRSMMEPNADVVAGYAQVMPTYQGTLTPAEAGAIVELIESLRDTSGQAPGVALPRLDVTAVDGGAP